MDWRGPCPELILGQGEGAMAKVVRKRRHSSVLTVREVANYLNIHVNTVRRWSDLGILKGYRIGPRGDRRFSREDVAAFLPRGRRGDRDRKNDPTVPAAARGREKVPEAGTPSG